MENKVVLQRKQPTPFTVYYPIDGRTTEITWSGTTGSKINERAVDIDVFMYLKDKTKTFELGALVIKETDDETVLDEKNNINNVEEAEKSALTKEEIQTLLEKGNQNVLKKALNELTSDKTEDLKREIIRQVVMVATDLGIDSSAKRKVLCDWAGIDFENSDVIFDKNIEELHS